MDRCLIGKDEEESAECIIFDRPKARILWQLVFSLLGIAWMLSFLFAETNSFKLEYLFCLEEMEEGMESTLLCLF